MKISSKQLRKIIKECIINTLISEGITNKINDMDTYAVLMAFKSTFGEEAAEYIMSQMDIYGAIEDVYNKASEDKKREFNARIDGTFEEEPIDLNLFNNMN